MSSRALSLPSQGLLPVETTLTIMNGPARGTVYRVVARKVTIGRGSDNDIVIADDPKCSRYHAELILGSMGYEIRDVSDKNSITVDGHDTKMALLRDRSVFVLGLTQFAINYKNNPPAAIGLANETRRGGSKTSAHQRTRKTSPLRLVYLALGIFVLWMIFSDSNSKNSKKLVEQDIDVELKAAEQVKQQTETRHRPKDVSPNDIGFQQAQQAFIIGSRDYRKGQYERALSSFQACLSLFPAHSLCNRYMSLTQRKFSELVQYHMDVGRKYREQNQFSACAVSFRNVMVMLKDSTNKRYIEAKANFEACSERAEERY